MSNQLPGIPQQNGNPSRIQVQNVGGQSNRSMMDPEVLRIRLFMQNKIFETLLLKHSSPNDVVKKKLQDISKRLEEGLFKSAQSKEEYLNMDTLERRLQTFIRRAPQNHASQTSQYMNTPTPVGTMIPTPGIQQPQNVNSNVTTSSNVGPSSMITTSSGGAMSSSMPNSNGAYSNVSGGSFRGTEGTSISYQQPPSNFPMNSSNNMISGQRVMSQMIPTPGFSTNKNHSSMNVDNNNIGVDSSGVSQELTQKHGQNSRMLQNLGSAVNNGMRSLMQSRFQNGSVRSGVENNMQNLNSSGSSDSFLMSQNFGGSSRPLQQPTDTLQRHSLQGDGYNINTSESSINGNFYNNQNLDQSRSQTRPNSSTNQPNSQALHSTLYVRPPLTERVEKPHVQSSQRDPYSESYGNQKQSFERCDQFSDLGNRVKSEIKMEQSNEHLNGNFTRNSLSNDMNSTFLQDPQPMMTSEPEKSSSGKFSNEETVQEEFRQRMAGHDEAQPNNMLSEVSSIGQNVQRNHLNQRRWLLFLCHARRCKASKCQERTCSLAQSLWKHMVSCRDPKSCPHPRCLDTRKLLMHNKQCIDQKCPVCVPVRNYILSQRAMSCKNSDLGLEQRSISGTFRSSESGENKIKDTLKPSEFVVSIPENHQPAVKRLKPEPPSQSPTPESGTVFVAVNSVSSKEYEKNDNILEVKSEFSDVKMETSAGSNVTEVKNVIVDTSNEKIDGGPVLTSLTKEESIKIEKDDDNVKPEEVVSPELGTKSGKPKIKGVSLTELFTPEQIREHIAGLRQWVGQSKSKAEKNQAMENSMNENACQLCAVEKLSFEPPPIYCTPCGSRIKRNAMYYTVGAGDTRHYICIPCYNESRGDTIAIDGASVPKARLEKKKNDEDTEEWWVQCDKCETWQHQICALFNGRRNDGGQAEYTCPSCIMQEVERGERMPLPQSAVLGAKDLPKTILSDHIENRLFKKLKHERVERAKVQGKSYDEVPGADGIVVRVVSSVDKKLEVKPQFFEIFREENYPMEFPYKSKVVLLFQKIEGVEVCLFGMYVQEFGSECDPPNQRRVYLSYLDSVKYFRPDVRTVTGEALRTFVYHEILIGYLEYCKKRGFTSCYIWACPPLKGEDYILYCHPEIQKTPKSDKLREWYLAMLRKASRENIVVELTNLYDHFFVQTGECKAKVTASRLPYFDGDYWPGAAEDMINQINQEEEGRKLNKKGPTKKTITKRVLKATGQSDLSSNASKDILLMHKLGETISPMKEDFIMVHLQYACTHCCLLMVSGKRWSCNQCKNFQLCDKCYEAELNRDDRERHPINQKDKHVLSPIEITEVPEETKDKDEILESEFFDTRQAFLSLCQGNHYQYDTLRRAKHSSMMVLYHLHNPTAPAFVTTCSACHLDIETGQGWRCETCPDFDICNSCYQKGGIDHPHKLTNHPSIADRDAQNKEARQQRVVQLRKMLDLLVHASQCRSPHCQYPNCRKVKGLFRHGMHCRVRASGGCVLCKKMWYLLQLHARACKESQCHVPRCRDLKEHLRRLQQQSDSRRRAAVMEMMRQRAAEVAGNNN